MAEAQSQPKSQLNFEDFIEAATRAAMRAVASRATPGDKPAIQPQPFPPNEAGATAKPPRIFIGIVASQE